MPWYSKEQPTPFDNTPISGLEFLHGDLLAKQYQQVWVEGKKYPLIAFPSGVKREIRRNDEHPSGVVHLFDEVEVGYGLSRDEAHAQALALVVRHGYHISVAGKNTLHIANPNSKRTYELTYDNQTKHLANIELYPRHAMELLGGEQRALLPPLYHNEKIGLGAIAPLKFFTPDAHWTWYPTEFDGDDIFFGLVSGFAVELGYFSLTELESITGGLALPIERDLWFKPTSIKDLIKLHGG
jgi:Protein of unknown function (DUF2958)